MAMTASTEQEVPLVFAVPLLRGRRIIALAFVGFYFLVAIYLLLGMGVHRFVNALSEDPIMSVFFFGILGGAIVFFLKMAYPSRRSLAKLEARHDSIRFIPAPFLNRFLGEPILEATITPQAKEIVLSRDLRDKLSTTWNVSIRSTGEPERSFKTTRLNLTTAQQGHRIVEGIGVATGLPVRMVSRQQTANGAIEETPWSPPASQGKLFGLGLAILVIPYIGGAIVGYIFPGSAVILAVGFALWLFDVLAISSFARRSRPRTQNLGVHLLARFFMFWTGYGFAFVIVAYVLRGH
jgi:hypothetical protein